MCLRLCGSCCAGHGHALAGASEFASRPKLAPTARRLHLRTHLMICRGLGCDEQRHAPPCGTNNIAELGRGCSEATLQRRPVGIAALCTHRTSCRAYSSNGAGGRASRPIALRATEIHGDTGGHTSATYGRHPSMLGAPRALVCSDALLATTFGTTRTVWSFGARRAAQAGREVLPSFGVAVLGGRLRLRPKWSSVPAARAVQRT